VNAKPATSFYVHRVRQQDQRQGWTGPIRSRALADREAEAWRQVGWDATVHPSTPDTKRKVRAWERAVRQERTP
jgi:hypothetical protein